MHNLTHTVVLNKTEDHKAQERLFRMSPLSSKMQEDTEGDEQNSHSPHTRFHLDQSINS